MIKRYDPITDGECDPPMVASPTGFYVIYEDHLKDSDQMYLTGINDAYNWAMRWGYHDFADRMVNEVNDRASRSGLPMFKP